MKQGHNSTPSLIGGNSDENNAADDQDGNNNSQHLWSPDSVLSAVLMLYISVPLLFPLTEEETEDQLVSKLPKAQRQQMAELSGLWLQHPLPNHSARGLGRPCSPAAWV